MRKRNKLYTANKWNQSLFADNIFDVGGNMQKWDQLASQAYGARYGDKGYGLNDYMQSKNSLGISKESNPFSKGNIGTTGQMIGGALLSTPTGQDALDTFDPVYHLAGGRESSVGNGLSQAGKSIFTASAASGNPWGMLAGAGLKVVGGLTNAAFGIKTDKTALNNANNAINYYGNFKSDAADFDDVTGPITMASFSNPYKGGWFSGGKARRKNEALKAEYQQAESYANRSVDNNINNIADTQMDTLMGNYAAFGGPLGTSTGSQGAIDYGFMSDYLTTKNKATTIKDKVSANPFGSLPVTPLSTFAFGGDMQTNGADFGSGLTFIDKGGSHESNPYGGVQVGKDSDGTPNLVEEGETIFDDYVFSKRIKVDKQTKDRFHLGKNADMTYADLSKKLQKESEERPNDAISQQGLTKQMHDLADEQERQKADEQAQQARDMFESLPPEQQAEIMQQVAQEQQAQQMAQQQEVQQQDMQQPAGGMQEQPTEQQMMGQQQQTEQPMQEENVQMNACGGKINRYDKGGDMKRKIYNLLKLHTDSDFDKWAYDQKLDKITDWENITKNKAFINALAGVNPTVADAMSRGYDFGAYTPNNSNKLTFDFTHGGWGKEDYDAWDGSTDAAWKEAVEKGLVKKGMKSDEIGKALMQTDAYKRGSDWLKADEGNRLAYLQAIYNSEDAPEAARKFAGKYVDANGWLKDAKRDYQTIFEDPNGTGVRNTHPGTYWKTPNEILRDKVANNYVVNDDGTVEEIVGDVPKDWASLGNFNWQTDTADNAANYYQRPVVTDNGNTNGNANGEGTVEPIHKPTWGRTAGLLGPIVGLGMQAAGIGKPDYSGLDASLEAISESPALAHYKPIGNYLEYNPMDIWYEQNRMNANSRATDRAIINSASPRSTKTAGLLANGYNSMIASGDLYRKALEYNDAQKQKVAEFNRGTDMYNADAFTKTSATNADILNRYRQTRASVIADNARQRLASDAAWNQGIYGNVNNLFAGLGAWGKENEQNNMIADMAADGIFGTMSDKQNIGRGKVRVTKSAKGGCIRRKRKGLTF